LSREHVRIGDEHGVQGRFQHHIRQIVTAILSSQQTGISFADFKVSASAYARIPDVAGIDQLGGLSFVGELKSSRVVDHDLSRAALFESSLKVLGVDTKFFKVK
jgi:hypothetical protein